MLCHDLLISLRVVNDVDVAGDRVAGWAGSGSPGFMIYNVTVFQGSAIISGRATGSLQGATHPSSGLFYAASRLHDFPRVFH